MELEAGLLSFILFSDGHVAQLSMWVGLSYCDGDWNQLSLAKRGSVISAAVNDWAEETRGVGGPGRLNVDSPLYLGGVPEKLIHPALNAQSHRHGEICWITLSHLHANGLLHFDFLCVKLRAHVFEVVTELIVFHGRGKKQSEIIKVHTYNIFNLLSSIGIA